MVSGHVPTSLLVLLEGLLLSTHASLYDGEKMALKSHGPGFEF